MAITVTATAHGQGKLGRVREAVRQNKPRQKEPKQREKPKRSEHDHDDRDERDKRRDRERHQRNRSSHRSHGRHRDRSPNLSFSSAWFNNPAPVYVVDHHVASVAPAPVIATTPQPMHETVADPTVQPQPTTPLQPSVGETFFANPPNFDWAARLSALGGTDFANITHGSLALLIQPRGELGIDTSVTMLRESDMNVRDHLYLGDLNLTFEPAVASDRFRLRIGAGVNWLGDSYGGDAGFNMTGGLDWKLSERWLITGEVDFGTIGDTDLIHAQVSLGRALSEQTELTFGYNYHDIGGITIGSAFTGLRFRF